MDNLLRDDRIYIAGIMDGEGSFGLHKHKNKRCKRGWYYQSLVCMVNTDKKIMQWMSSIINVNHKCVSRRKGKMKPTWSPCYVWYLGRIPEIIQFIEMILPFLKIKKKRAELLLEYCKIRLYKQPRKGKTFEYTTRQHEIYSIIKKLNRTGPK